MYVYTDKKREGVVAAVDIKRSRYTVCALWVETHRERERERLGPHISIRKHARIQICFLYIWSHPLPVLFRCSTVQRDCLLPFLPCSNTTFLHPATVNLLGNRMWPMFYNGNWKSSSSSWESIASRMENDSEIGIKPKFSTLHTRNVSFLYSPF